MKPNDLTENSSEEKGTPPSHIPPSHCWHLYSCALVVLDLTPPNPDLRSSTADAVLYVLRELEQLFGKRGTAEHCSTCSAVPRFLETVMNCISWCVPTPFPLCTRWALCTSLIHHKIRVHITVNFTAKKIELWGYPPVKTIRS